MCFINEGVEMRLLLLVMSEGIDPLLKTTIKLDIRNNASFYKHGTGS